MKKLFAILLAVSMAATAAVPALAATAIDDGGAISAKGNKAGNYTLGVHCNYIDSNTTDNDVISVDITWDALDFTYTASGRSYDLTTHTTTVNPGKWSDNKAGITITNHSNVPVSVGFTFEQANDLPDNSTITGKFYDKTGDGETAAYTENIAQKLSLASGEDTTNGKGTYVTPTATIYFGIDSTNSMVTAKVTALGTITINIAGGTTSEDTTSEGVTGVTVVTTAEALIAALNAVAQTGGTIKFGADIASNDNSFTPSAHKDIVLDLNGHTLTGSLYRFAGSDNTSKVTIKNGTIHYSGNFKAVVHNNAGAMELDGVTIKVEETAASATTALYNGAGGTMTVTNCTFNGGGSLEGHAGSCSISNDGAMTFSGKIACSGYLAMRGSDCSVTCSAGCEYKLNGSADFTTVESETVYTGVSGSLPSGMVLMDK